MNQIDANTIIGAAAAILGAASLLLHFIAPRTKNTIDDRLRDDIDELLAYARGSTRPAPTVIGPVGPMPPPPGAPPRGPEIGRVGLTVATLLATIGLLCWACASVGPAVSTGAVAALDCEAPDIARVFADLLPIAESAVERWIGDGGKVDTAGLKADMAQIKSDLGRCLEARAIAAIGTTRRARSAGANALVDGTQALAAFAAARGELGWAPVRLPSGQVL